MYLNIKEQYIWKLPLKLLEYDETYQFDFCHYFLGQVDTVMYVFLIAGS